MQVSDSDIARRAEVAESLARECTALALEFRRDPVRMNVQAKGLRDYVTAADTAVERLIRDRLAREFPGDGFLGEEGGGTTAQRLWVVDPIDGTTNFSRGLAGFAVSIAFCQDGRPEIGVIAEPAIGTIFTARRGGGAFRNGAPIRTSGIRDIDRCLIDFGYTENRGAADNLNLVRRLLDASCDIRQGGSAALGLARVAAGECDGYCELHINSWDVLAGLVLVEEAGGRVSDFLAGDGMLCGNPVLAAASGIAERLASICAIALR